MKCGPRSLPLPDPVANPGLHEVDDEQPITRPRGVRALLHPIARCSRRHPEQPKPRTASARYTATRTPVRSAGAHTSFAGSSCIATSSSPSSNASPVGWMHSPSCASRSARTIRRTTTSRRKKVDNSEPAPSTERYVVARGRARFVRAPTKRPQGTTSRPTHAWVSVVAN